jgi:hypothetical protein
MLANSSDRHLNGEIIGPYCILNYRAMILERIQKTYRQGSRELAGFDYDNFFAATDTLLDVENILFVAESSEWPSDDYVAQLWMYGAMQAIAVQQEAMWQLIDCFELKSTMPIEAEKKLEEINDLRVCAVGHPHNHTHKKRQFKGCTFLSHRENSEGSSFAVVTLDGFNKSVFRAIEVQKLIRQQRVILDSCLSRVWNKIHLDPRYDGICS